MAVEKVYVLTMPYPLRGRHLWPVLALGEHGRLQQMSLASPLSMLSCDKDDV